MQIKLSAVCYCPHNSQQGARCINEGARILVAVQL